MRNLFCDDSDLRNEEDVVQSFARRLIEALGYSDSAIRPKTSLERLSVGNVGEDRYHRPDFAMKSGGHIRWVLEAKTPGDHLDRHFDQANRYCQSLNASYSLHKPVRWVVLTNGIETKVHSPGDAQPVLALHFSDFGDGNLKYRELVNLLRPDAFPSVGAHVAAGSGTIHFRKPSIAEVNQVFAKCHQHIHQSDSISQAAGFVEFVKLITLKLLSDKNIKDAYPGLVAERDFDHPADEVSFSAHWVKTH